VTGPICLTGAACVPEQFAVKQFWRNGQKADYGFIKFWRYYPREYASLDALCEALLTASGLSNCIVLRAEPVPGLDLNQWQLRRLHARGPEPATLRAASRSWIALDLDDVRVQFGMGFAERLADAAEYIRDNLLPVAFWGKACIITATASTGRKGPLVARLRLWFWIDRPIDDKTLSRWATGLRHATDLPIDPAVFRPVQPIYVGRPVFHGMPDPVPPELRAFVLEGDPTPVGLDVREYEEPLVKAEKRINAKFAKSPGLGGDWQEAAEVLVGGPDGYFIPLTRVLGLAAKTTTEIDDAEICTFVRDLLDQKGAGADRLVGYGDDWIRRSLKAFRDADARKSSPPGS
jgi:hypothetical protein